jgi:hypothetical protein
MCFHIGSKSKLDVGSMKLSVGLIVFLALVPLLAVSKMNGPRPKSDEILFRKHTIDLGSSESCAVVDVNKDGRLDIVSSESWYEQQPHAAGRSGRWIKHEFRKVGYNSFYIENLIDIGVDVNGDGFTDIVSSSYWSKPFTWWENPGRENKAWRETVITSGSPVEFVFLVDLLGTGKPSQLLPQFGKSKTTPLSWFELVGTGTDAKWTSHEVSPQSYGHGIGAGDVNGDGRTDIITPKGWFEAPLDRRKEKWVFHSEFELGNTGFIYAIDINGDSLADLVTSLGHDYGIFWFEQRKDASGQRTWEKHVIDKSWSQAHALTLADLNGDGQPDFVTGKRFMAHNGNDPGEREPLGVYWYEWLTVEGRLEWKRHIIDYSTRAGGGMQIPVVDIDRDGDLDVVTPGKSGLFLFEQVQSSEEVH